MSYTAPNFVDDVQSALTDLGYTVEYDEEFEGWFWRFGPYDHDTKYDEESAAWIAAFHDFIARVHNLRVAAATVLGRWDRGNLADAVRYLQSNLDGAIDGDVEDYIKKHG